MSEGAIHPEVLNGRNPWWREAWEELSPEERESIKRAFRSGERVPDGGLPFAYGLLAIERRRLRWMPLQLLWVEALVGVWIYFHCVRARSFWCWMFIAIAVLGVAGTIYTFVTVRRRLRRAERANL